MSSSQQRFGTDFCKKKTWHVFNTLGSLFALRKRSPIDHLLSTTLVVAHDAHRNSGTTLLPHVVTSFKTISGTWLNQFSTFPTFCWFLLSALRLVRWHLEILLPLEDRFRSVAFSSQVTQNSAPVSWSWNDLDPLSCCLWRLFLQFRSQPVSRSQKEHHWREFDLLSERLLCRCNLPAQDYVRLLHVISSARIEILDLVLGIILHNKRHPDYVSNCCDSALSSLRNCVIITGCFFIWIFSERVERCEEDGLSSFLALFSSCNESVLKDGLDAERTTPCETQTLSNRAHQFKRNCCFLHGWVEANLFLKNLVRTLSAVSALSCSNGLLHHNVGLPNHNDVPIFVTILEIAVGRDPLRTLNWQE